MFELRMSAPTNLFASPPSQPVAAPFASFEAAADFVDQLAGGFDASGGSRAAQTACSYRAVAAALRIGSHAGFIDGVSYNVRETSGAGRSPC